jgi:starch synthase
MRILFAATEMEPFASTGGMGDVLGALPPALSALGAEVSVVMPRYGFIDSEKLGLKPYGANERYATVGGLKKRFRVLSKQHDSVEVLFVDQPTFFDRDRIYGTTDSDYPDNAARFVFFSRAVLQLAASMEPRPDVIHFHDWHTSLGPVYMACDPETMENLSSVAAVLTIHNLGYQGIFPRPEMLTADLGPELFNQDAMEFWGQMNFLKGGIVFSDAVIAVSSKYAEEIQTDEFGFGLEGIVRDHSKKTFGIINGANYTRWDPATDPSLPANYDRTNLQGKTKCKSALQKEMKLAENPTVPLVGMVTRLVEQKGLDLLVDSIERLMELDVQFAVLGLGAERYHTRLLEFAERWPGKFSAVIGFNERLSHLIEGGSDIFLMPSRYEPCGLNQIYSLRYGTIPVVRTTGGLDDTVIDVDVDPARGNGFKFDEFDSMAMTNRLTRALSLFGNDQQRWRKIMDNAFAADFSWDVSAHRHLEVYRWARKHKQSSSNVNSESSAGNG